MDNNTEGWKISNFLGGGGDKQLEDEIGKLGFSNKAQTKKKSLKTVELAIPLFILI